MKALLLSGGMDSIALAFWKKPDVAITIDYGQCAAEAELAAAAHICSELQIRHEKIAVDCSALGSGDMAATAAIAIAPVTEWWPFRNQILVTLAAMRAVAIDVRELMLGAVASDDAHADGRADFIAAMDRLLSLQEGGLRLSAPALHLSTENLILKSAIPRPLLAWAHSCHRGNFACGDCRGCFKHYQVTRNLFGDAY